MAAQEKFDLIIRAKDEASVTLRNVNGEINRLATGSVPNVARATDGMAAAFSRADLKMVALGTRLSGLPPVLNNVISAFAFGSPVVAGLSFGLGILTEAIFSNNEQLTEYATTLGVTNEQLAKLAETTGLVGEKASFLKEQRLAALKAEEQALTAQIAGINVTKTVAQEYDRLGGITSEQTRVWNEQRIEADNLKIKLEGLNAQLATNREEQAKLTAEDTKAADATAKLTEETKKLIAAQNLRNIGGFGPITTVSQVDEMQRLADELARQQERLAGGDAFGGLAEGPMSMIWEREEQQHKQMVDTIQHQQDELAGYIESSVGRAMSGILEVFTEGRINLGNIFKGMAADFIQFFVQQIARSVGAKIAGALLGAAVGSVIPGVGTVVGAGGGAAAGGAAGDFIVPTDVLGKQAIPVNAVQASAPVIIVTAPLSLTQDFVRKHVMPEIKRLQMVGAA